MEIGLVFQLHNLLPNLTALENVQIPMFGTGMNHSERLKRGRELLDEMGLAEKEKMTPPRLSGGERQRLAIARALANDPSIILADEPTGNLDSAAVDRLLALFRGIRDEHHVTILLATHDTHVASSADRIVHMKDGRIVESPQPEEQPSAAPGIADQAVRVPAASWRPSSSMAISLMRNFWTFPVTVIGIRR